MRIKMIVSACSVFAMLIGIAGCGSKRGMVAKHQRGKVVSGAPVYQDDSGSPSDYGYTVPHENPASADSPDWQPPRPPQVTIPLESPPQSDKEPSSPELIQPGLPDSPLIDEHSDPAGSLDATPVLRDPL